VLTRLRIPDPALVLLVGPSGAGKSTFAERHFLATEVVSSDFARALVADDPADQSASADAFKIVELIVSGRLRRRLFTVVDATNLHAPSRRRFRRMAERYGVPAVAIAFDLPAEVYVRHNSLRDGRTVDDDVVAKQAARMPATLAALPDEGYAAVYVLTSPEAVARARVERVRQARPGNAAV
jgi:predicted kinase